MNDNNRLRVVFLGVWSLVLVLASCTGAAWGPVHDAALDVTECTLERLLEQARRAGNATQAHRIEAVILEEPAP